MIDFQFHRPRSLEEAFGLLERHRDDARVMAGGTALVLQMKQRLAQPGHVISLRGIPGLDTVETVAGYSDGMVEIGALCSHRRLEVNPLVNKRLPLVAWSFRSVGTPRIRNVATIGGSLVHGDPSQDPPPPLIALRASAVLSSAGGRRVVPVEELFVDYYETDLHPGEILTSVLIPPAPDGSGAAYLKFLPRTADDYGTVSVAAVVTPAEDGTCLDLRLVLGSVGATPVHATKAEAVLRGKLLAEENIRACAEAARDEVDPLDDFRGSAAYKRDMAEVFVRRAIHQALAASRRV